MKQKISFFIAILIAIVATRANAQGINFQGVARSANGTIIAGSKISLRLTIISKNANGTPEYVEARTVNTNAQGIFSVVLGDSSIYATVGSFNNVTWKEGQKFLKVEMDPNGGTNYVSMGTTQLQNVPFSFYALGVDAANISGILPVAKGGTGVATLAELKTALSLDKVNNIADIDKPISTLTQTALDAKLAKADTLSLSNRINAIVSSNIINTANENIAIGKNAIGSNTTAGGNLAIGNGAMQSLGISNYNTAIGMQSMQSTTTGNNNTAVGIQTLLNNTTGYENSALGSWALKANTTGTYNTAIGHESLVTNTTGGSNTALGKSTMVRNTTGTSNSAVGVYALYNNTTGSNNYAFGNSSLYKNQTSNANLAIGSASLYNHTTGEANIALGHNALFTDVSGYNNVAIGYNSLYNNTTGAENIAIGRSALFSNTIGSPNIGIGTNALTANTTGYNNVGIGMGTLAANTTGAENIAIGRTALTSNTIGSPNVGIGTNALAANTTGYNNVGIGMGTLAANTTGAENIAIGRSALLSNTIGSPNLAIGTNALGANTTGYNNFGIGMSSLEANTTGAWNIALGRSALAQSITGGNNVAIGNSAGSKLVSGDKNIFIGNYAGANQNYLNTSNKLVVQNDSSRSPLIYGEFDNKLITINGDLFVSGNIRQFVSSNTTGGNNTIIGASAMASNTTGSQNVAIGDSVLKRSTTGNNNTAVGYRAMSYNITGTENSAFGILALQYNTGGVRNNAFGNGTMSQNTSGFDNSAFGSGALLKNTTGSKNTAVGNEALTNNTTSESNTAVGYRSLTNNTTGNGNVAVGQNALFANTTGAVNNAFGGNALLSNTTATANNAFGSQTLEQNTTGTANAGFGHNVLQQNITGNGNTAMGYASLNANLASYNTATGWKSLQANTTGTENAAFGEEALTVNTTGSYVTAIGAEAGKANTTGSNNTFLGASANTSVGTISNSTAVGYNAIVTASNQIQLGNGDVTKVNTAGVISSSRGFLPPKMKASERDAIVNPEQGLTIYCYNCGTYGELEVYNGNSWVNPSGAATAATITDVTTGLVASFPLDGSPSGTNTTTATQVSTVTKAMTSGWTYTLPATDPTKSYKLVVTGTWGIANGNAHRDAAYDAGSSNTIGVSGTPVANRGCDANWSFEGACPPPVPNAPAGYASNHTYEYLIGNGKSGGYAVAFSDGSYVDNVGSLTFTLYEVGIAGSTNGTVTYTTNRKGAANSAMQGGAGYITAPSSIFQFTRTQAFTVSVWFTADAVTSSGRLLSTENSEGNFRISKYDLNNIAVQYGDYITQTVTNNDWHHLVYTYDNRLEKVYIDGVLVQTNTDASTEALNYGAPFTIGAKAASAYDKWAGKIDDVKIYNRALVPSEVMVLFNQ